MGLVPDPDTEQKKTETKNGREDKKKVDSFVSKPWVGETETVCESNSSSSTCPKKVLNQTSRGRQ
jgi:hypothetical protein